MRAFNINLSISRVLSSLELNEKNDPWFQDTLTTFCDPYLSFWNLPFLQWGQGHTCLPIFFTKTKKNKKQKEQIKRFFVYIIHAFSSNLSPTLPKSWSFTTFYYHDHKYSTMSFFGQISHRFGYIEPVYNAADENRRRIYTMYYNFKSV